MPLLLSAPLSSSSLATIAAPNLPHSCALYLLPCGLAQQELEWRTIEREDRQLMTGSASRHSIMAWKDGHSCLLEACP
eukprot:501793-Rhodomonas_salina.1